MARQRMIHPEIWESSDFKKLSNNTARLAFIRVVSMADDEGKGKASVLMGFSTGFPQKIVEKVSRELEKVGMVYFYGLKEGMDTVYYYQIPKWFRYQKINRPSPSKIRNHPNFKEIVPKEYHGKYSMNSFTEPIHGTHSLNPFTEPIHAEVKGREEKKSSQHKVIPSRSVNYKGESGDSQFIHKNCYEKISLPKGVPTVAIETLCDAKVRDNLCTMENHRCRADLVRIQTRIKKVGGPRISNNGLWQTSCENFVMEYRAELIGRVKEVPPTIGQVLGKAMKPR